MGGIKSVFDYTWDGEEGVGGGCAAFIKNNRPSRGVWCRKKRIAVEMWSVHHYKGL